MKNPLKNEIKFLKGVGEFRAKLLHKLAIYTIEDLMEHFPRDYINRKSTKKISDLEFEKHCSVIGKIISVEKRRFSRRKRQLNVYITDGENNLLLTWFNFGKWLSKKFEIGKKIWVSGLVSEFRGSLQIIHPDIEILDEKQTDDKKSFWHSRPILPVYALTEKISMKLMRKLIYNAFNLYHSHIQETLPEYILKRYHFEKRNKALQKMHFATKIKHAEKIKQRFIYEELFYYQLMLARVNNKHTKAKAGNSFALKRTYTTVLKKSLPFELTGAQKRVIREIVNDMSSQKQMNRLLQGDVGSGKTIVILFAMLLAVENGLQAAMMVPTEILAEQHYLSINEFLKNQPEIKISLLKGGSYKGKDAIKEQIKEGKVDIIIGTHALIQKDTDFKNLGLVVIDEQHRFGVEQRAELSRRNNNPDIIYLSATPIPRSLALTVYGDLDMSIIDEMPPNRKKIKTIWRSAQKKNLVYEKICSELKQGRQIYIVCPLIEESEKIDLLDAERTYQEISKNIFPDYNSEILHGRMKTTEKDTIMQRFKQKKVDILVSTTVIEVGIDIPDATIMMIEHAERFGLSQLHQLRGRVGRSSKKSYCYLIAHYPISSDARQRLDTMVKYNDGFKIAEKDLKLRGPGEFFGTKQSGTPQFKHANLLKHQNILKTAREDAFEIIEADYNLTKKKNGVLKKQYEEDYIRKEKMFDF